MTIARPRGTTDSVKDHSTPPGFGTKLLPPALPEKEEITPESLETLLNILQRWIADTHAPDNPVWMKARQAVPTIRKFLASKGYEAKPVWQPRHVRSQRGVSVEEINSLDAARDRIRSLERTVAAFYGEEGSPEPDGPDRGEGPLF